MTEQPFKTKRFSKYKTTAKRSAVMSKITSKNTKPEVVVRKLLFNAGYRYRLHKKEIKGKPDLFLRKFNTAIFVHGCFWHHHNCHIGHLPKSNTAFWADKIKRNLVRDKNNIAELQREGYRVLVIWECAITGKNKLETNYLLEKITHFLKGSENMEAITGEK
ncbi:MAG: very short patch repair endonuclease [Alphaproteobacteria bacterium]|nr:very short patch repair endonuclease [Alphaproteobacteria bacterium]|tara:strand:+ start:785 stop:1270 length:486 start_codon:yes stop_codon:yes gene_type:complete